MLDSESEKTTIKSNQPTNWLWHTNKYVRYAGQKECAYSFYYVIEKINQIAIELNEIHPTIADDQIWVGDASLLNGNCFNCFKYNRNCGGHGTAHEGFQTIDVNYFTREIFNPAQKKYGNATQYKPAGYRQTNIWYPGGLFLKKKMIDWKRHLFFWELILDKFTTARLTIHEDIFQFVQDCVYSEWGRSGFRRMVRIGVKTTFGKYFHHKTHMHLDLVK